jgi:hypothetical protein
MNTNNIATYDMICQIMEVIFMTQQYPDTTINAWDFGLRETEDAVPAIRRALETCRRNGAAQLIIPKGEYQDRR